MSATFISDLPNTETQSAATTKLINQIEIELSKCECCGLTEECTPAYIKRVRERYLDHWICGLCAEAIKYEILRSSSDQSLISTEEAIANHMNFFKKFKTSVPPPDPTLLLISALRQILRRSTLNSPTSALRSTPTKIDREICSPGLTRSDNCFPTFST